MDRLPLHVLRMILYHVDMKDKFLLMRVSRSFESACRSLISSQRTLDLRSDSHLLRSKVLQVYPRRSTVFFPSSSSELDARLWLSLSRMKSLTEVSVSYDLVYQLDAPASAIITANAAHLQELIFCDVIFVDESRPSLGECLQGIPLPKLRSVNNCFASDVEFLVNGSPLLRRFTISRGILTQEKMDCLSRLANLLFFETDVDLFQEPTDAILTLLRGASRFQLRDLLFLSSEDDVGYDREAIEEELDSIERVTGRAPVLL